MTIVDTNLVSELAKRSPSKRVMEWWDSNPRDRLFITAITQAEILFGIALLPTSRRRTQLENAARETFEISFEGRVLPFDSEAAEAFARISAARRKLGRPISLADAQIAAIARSRGAALATRKTADFDHCGIRVVNPWG
jgi:toxin FitB